MANVNLGKVALTPKGNWDNTITYEKLDVVTYDGNSYIAKTGIPIGTSVTTGTEYWQLFTEKGNGISVGDVIIASTTQPTVFENKLWIREGSDEEFDVLTTEDIDDTKGEGDTDYIWSADKIWKMLHMYKGHAKNYVTTTLMSEITINGYFRIQNNAITSGLITDTPDGMSGSLFNMYFTNRYIQRYYSDSANIYMRTIIDGAASDWKVIGKDEVKRYNFSDLLTEYYDPDGVITIATLSDGGIGDNGINLNDSSATYRRTGYITFDKPITIEFKSNDYMMNVWVYQANDQTKKLYSPTNGHLLIYDPIFLTNLEASIKFRLSFRRKDFAAMTNSDNTAILNNLTITKNFPKSNLYLGMAKDFVTTTLMSEITKNGYYRIMSSHISGGQITDAPDSPGGMLFNIYFSSRYIQFYYSYTHNIYYRQITDSVGDWITIGENNYENFPNYWKTHLDSKIIDIISHENVINGDEFVFITDYHYTVNMNYSPKLIRYLLNKTGAHFVVCGGDLDYNDSNVSRFKQTMREIKTKFDHIKNMKFIIGNHEWNNQANDKPAQQLTKGEIYDTILRDHEDMPNVMMGNNLDYYFDNPSRKIRYYCLSCNHAANFNSEWQPQEFLQILADMPAEWDFVVIAHAMINRSTLDYLSTFKNIADGCDAYNAHTTHTYSGTTYDYSGKTGKCIIILCGHGHTDVDTTTDGGIPIVMTTCDRMPDLPSGVDNNGRTRTQGTDTEHAFDVVQIDKDARKVYLTRIGCGSDREFSY